MANAMNVVPDRWEGRRWLRPLGRAHRTALLIAAADAATREAFGHPRESVEVWVDETVRAARDGLRVGSRFDFVLFAKSESGGGRTLVGAVTLVFDAVYPQVATLAYWIEASNRGRGHATSACRSVLRLGFDQLGASRVTTAVRAENLASARVLARLGFRPSPVDGRFTLTRADLIAGPACREGETVLTIRSAQRAALQAAVDRRFVRTVVTRARAAFPRTLAAETMELERVALEALERARRHALRSDADLAAFVELALLVSPRFDEHPTVAAALRVAGGAPERRMASVLAAVPADVWSAAARPR
ncbi:MAG: GNAT family N-acetyltransferase [Polyangiaceae bacterium]|nr:GNAT family N-acetyltransferase [Polyangiaceae bacterium]